MRKNFMITSSEMIERETHTHTERERERERETQREGGREIEKQSNMLFY